MRNRIKSLLAAVLALALVLTMLPAASRSAQAADNDALKEELVGLSSRPASIISIEPPTTDPETGKQTTGYVLIDNPGSTSLTDAYLAAQASGADSVKGSLPSRYNSADYGYVTPVRDQNPYGTCWAHGAIASIESYMIKHKITDAATGLAAAKTMNYSESHLAWFTFTYAYDKLGMLNGDKTTNYVDSYAPDYRDRGGNGYLATFTLMRGEGPASEKTSALAYNNMTASGLDQKYAYDYNAAQVTDVEWIPKTNIAAVKQAIMDYGAGEFTYYHDDAYLGNKGAYYNYQNSGGNHAVTVVGWDDSYSRYNFNKAATRDGAWIIKNSWGTGYFDQGYTYISYDDVSCPSEPVCFFKVAPKDTYKYIYQYDGTGSFYYYWFNDGRKSTTLATSFVAKSAEDLEAVSLCTLNENTKYTLKIYVNCKDASNPSSGTLATTKSGTLTYQGYHTIPLNETVWLSKGQRYSVVFTLTAPDSLYFFADQSCDIGFYYCTHTTHANSAFLSYDNGSTWENCSSTFNFRIKALTSPHICPFKDVVKGKWYYEPVLWAYYHNPQITAGTDDTHFSPKATCTRSQIVTFLWHANYDPAPGSTVNPFTDDVKPGKWYTNAVLWAYYHNPQITSGKTATSFGINNGCKREQVVTFLWNAAGAPKPKTTYCPFTDVDPTKYYYKAVLWAVENGITSGIDATTFGVGQTCTRAQIVTFLYTAYGNQ